MFKLHSSRLSLWALPYQQLLSLSKNRNDLEMDLGLCRSEFEINAGDDFLSEFAQALHNFVLPQVKLNPSSYEWFSHWLIIDRNAHTTVGGIGANGLPDENGQVMIGYYVDSKFENRGFATESVICLTDWMRSHPKLERVIADTLIENRASQRVLQKAGFRYWGEVEEGYRWQLAR